MLKFQIDQLRNFWVICDILESEVVGSRDTFSKLQLPEKKLPKGKIWPFYGLIPQKNGKLD